MTLRSCTSDKVYGGLFKDGKNIARTWETFSERYGYIKRNRKRFKLINIEIYVDNNFKVTFEI